MLRSLKWEALVMKLLAQVSPQHFGLKQCTAGSTERAPKTVILKEILLVCSGLSFLYAFSFNQYSSLFSGGQKHHR